MRGRSSTVFGPSVYRGNPARRAVALTFDDGPSEGTLPLLELLAREDVPATFFQCGRNVERLPATAREVGSAGHEIGNHSHTHPLFCFRSPGFMETELTRAQEAITHATGVTPTLWRAPFGVRWWGMGRAQRRLGLLGVMWTVIGYDWRLEAESIVARVLRGVGNGAIICLHDGRELRIRPDIRETIEAVRRLIPLLQGQGYSFETVSQLLCPTT
ncbi:MAG TPA: polysaccharide deacetylase family protein [Bryobacteraceae bacterium]|nr:polysaccharide deacetylase family protein [Bryobacteraceae bacterium]